MGVSREPLFQLHSHLTKRTSWSRWSSDSVRSNGKNWHLLIIPLDRDGSESLQRKLSINRRSHNLIYEYLSIDRGRAQSGSQIHGVSDCRVGKLTFVSNAPHGRRAHGKSNSEANPVATRSRG